MKRKRKIAWIIASPILLILSPFMLILGVGGIIVWMVNELMCENKY